jgi:hypothetical protein
MENFNIAEGCVIDEDSGEILSDSCYFAAAVQNTAISSLASYQYTDLVSVFCDDEYFPHNHDTTNRQNDKCLDDNGDPMSTWATILGHTDFAYGQHGGGYVESTIPEFSVFREASASFQYD